MGEVKRLNLKEKGAKGGVEIASVVLHNEKASFALDMTKGTGVNPYHWADIAAGLMWEVAKAFASVTGGAHTAESLLKEMRKYLDDDLDRRVEAEQQKGLENG